MHSEGDCIRRGTFLFLFLRGFAKHQRWPRLHFTFLTCSMKHAVSLHPGLESIIHCMIQTRLICERPKLGTVANSVFRWMALSQNRHFCGGYNEIRFLVLRSFFYKSNPCRFTTVSCLLSQNALLNLPFLSCVNLRLVSTVTRSFVTFMSAFRDITADELDCSLT